MCNNANFTFANCIQIYRQICFLFHIHLNTFHFCALLLTGVFIMQNTSVADPFYFDTDPDPRIRFVENGSTLN